MIQDVAKNLQKSIDHYKDLDREELVEFGMELMFFLMSSDAVLNFEEEDEDMEFDSDFDDEEIEEEEEDTDNTNTKRLK